MKNLVTLILLALCATVLSACDPTTGNKTMSPDDYLTHNVSIWNGIASVTEPWVGGARGEQLLTDAAELKSMRPHRNALNNPRTQIASDGKGYEGFGIPDDAQDMDAKLKAYQKSTDTVLATLQDITALADGYTEAQVQPLLERLNTESETLDNAAAALDAAQNAYAKQHRIKLVTRG
ncbi:hypothetical protein FZ025_11280 [Xanthomonas hyacinthi]|uniref:DUF4142 domain-containing protein n=1 Tax=Xanthomonas hyacinthi TaxID=56455 RepID=A0A2S7EX69_9XANT|nr:hypothetical protein [Xanthomonas hyacinthi]KLD79669.1 hypothetical protein Y886_03090 [Xanthomonas hyacinthi DSM 19077]PPU97623.1 hypothetical protein XhyaCFBP1156_09680 [Xanthomonas hyacinthi]QGY77193.1 hypothetical protein FZ025_11280 [Xanthomonas hyacinthi]